MTTEANVLELLRSGRAPRAVRLAAARGLVPLALEELVLTLIRLTADPDRVVNADANASLVAIEEERLLPLLKNEATQPEVLRYFCFDPTRSNAVREAVVMNDGTPDDAIADLALVAETDLLDIMLLNQVRLIRHPALLNNMLENAAAASEARRRLVEIREEFFRKPASAAADESAPAAGSTPGSEEPPPGAELEELPPLEVEEPLDPMELGLSAQHEISTFQRITQLNTSEKVKLALLGSREERIVLVRDSNRVVATTVLKSPKITDQEIESISQMRNVSDEVLRIIAATREWTKSYSVVQNLVRNPKTPVAMSLRLLPRIMENDLRLLARDRSIPELVRRSAVRSLQSKGGMAR